MNMIKNLISKLTVKNLCRILVIAITGFTIRFILLKFVGLDTSYYLEHILVYMCSVLSAMYAGMFFDRLFNHK
jgi:hypothetical protein